MRLAARPRLDPRFPIIALVLIAHALFYLRALGWDAVDDAYISFRYAQNAILGHGLVFNPGERVEGFTNFLWTALMVPLAGLHVDIGRASILLGVLFALAVLWLTLRIARALGLSFNVGLFAALLLAVDGSFAIWSVSGLETSMFAFLVAAAILFYLREQDASPSTFTVPHSGLLFALAAMTRPEAAAVFALTAGHQLLWRLGAERRLFRRVGIARIAVFCAVFVPYWLLRWRYYHAFFPNSFYAKVAPGGPAAQLARGWHYVDQFVGLHLTWLILLPAFIAIAAAALAFANTPSGANAQSAAEPARAYSRMFGMSYLALVVLAYGGYITYVGGDWSVGRFFVPILAPAYLLIAAGLAEAWRFVTARFGALPVKGEGVAAVLVAVLALALAWSSSWNGEYGIFVKGFDAARATEAREAMGRWLEANVPDGTWIAVDAAGQVPYFSELPAIDMFGINDLHIGRLTVPTLGEGTPGHEKFDLGYVLGRSPRYVIIYGNLFDSVSEYRRSPASWTDNSELLKFLTLYERK